MPEQQVLNKRKLIKNLVPGLSYVDIGGLWGTKGETVTTASEAGASRAVMADIQEPGSTWWQKFEAHCAELGVQDYEKQTVDICDPGAPDALGTFDVVHCAGVMYHVPDLFRFLGNLVSVTDKYLLLSSVVMPSRIQGPLGTLSFGVDQAYLAPILSVESQQLVSEHLHDRGLHAEGLSRPAEYMKGGRPRFGPWWWLFSSAFMTRLVELHGLEIVEGGPTPNGNAYTVLAKVPGA